MRRWNKFITVIQVLVFILCITVPSLFSDKTGGALSPEENRYLASAPELFIGRRINWQGGELLQEVDSWINDNTYGRQYALDLLSNVHVKILKDAIEGQMLISDDWRFLWVEDIPDRAQHQDLINEAELEILGAKLQEIDRAMAVRGIAFCATLFPHKVELCGRYLPKEIYIPEGPCLTEQLYASLNDRGVMLSCAFDELKESMEAYAEGEGPLTYSRMYDGSHWNWRGAFVGYQVMMRTIQRLFPDLMILEEKDYMVIPMEAETTLRGETFLEEDSAWIRKEERQSRREDAVLNALSLDLQDPWKSDRSYVNEAHPEYPRAVIVGDSYLWMFFLDDLADSFSEMIFINQEDADELFSISDQFHPDVVVYAGINLHQFIDMVTIPE